MSSSLLLLKTVPLAVANKAEPQQLIADNFTFEDDITPAEVGMLRERHRFAFSSIMSCPVLNANERGRLINTYRLAIHHSRTNDPKVNASAFVGVPAMSVNFTNLFPQGPIEIAQTLIHEMMHCAGFSHPDRRHPPEGMSCTDPNPALFDCPFDNGQYYGTAPLRAEVCIGGSQSDMRARFQKKAQEERCVIDSNGLATIRRV